MRASRGLSSFSWSCSAMAPTPNRRSPTRRSLGTASLSISSLLVFRSGAKLEKPVTLPPGRARLATRPSATASPTATITMGIVVVAFFAAVAGPVPKTTIRSTLRRTKSAASSGPRPSFPSRKPILDGEILSLNPSKLAQLMPGIPSRGPPYQQQCFHPGNLCGGFSPPAARRRQSAEHRSREHRARRMIFLVIAFPSYFSDLPLLISDLDV